MADKIQFELVSPERLVFSRAVDMVVVPGGEGMFGVLPGHAPMITNVRAGAIDVWDDNQIVDRVFVYGGLAEVTAERLTVLAEHAMPVAELKEDAVEQEIRDLTEDVEDAKDEAARRAAEAQLAAARAKLEAITGTARAS